jgi:hypothetical protein
MSTTCVKDAMLLDISTMERDEDAIVEKSVQYVENILLEYHRNYALIPCTPELTDHLRVIRFGIYYDTFFEGLRYGLLLDFLEWIFVDSLDFTTTIHLYAILVNHVIRHDDKIEHYTCSRLIDLTMNMLREYGEMEYDFCRHAYKFLHACFRYKGPYAHVYHRAIRSYPRRYIENACNVAPKQEVLDLFTIPPTCGERIQTLWKKWMKEDEKEIDNPFDDLTN